MKAEKERTDRGNKKTDAHGLVTENLPLQTFDPGSFAVNTAAVEPIEMFVSSLVGVLISSTSAVDLFLCSCQI